MKLADLHTHLYGCLRSHHLLEVLRQRRTKPSFERYLRNFEAAFGRSSPLLDILPGALAGTRSDVARFEQLYVFGGDDADDFDKFSANFDLIAAASSIGQAMHDERYLPDAQRELRQVVDWVADDCRQNGVDAIECRFFLGSHASIELVREAATTILRQMEQHSHPQLRLALGLPRDNPEPLWEVAKQLRTKFSTLRAVDFCYVEEGFPPKQLRDFFGEVSRWNQLNPERFIAILDHVAESFRDKSLQSAIRWVDRAAQYGAHRIGHAIALGIAPENQPIFEATELVSERIDQIDYDLEFASKLRDYDLRVDEIALSHERQNLLEKAPNDRVIVSSTRDEITARQRFAITRLKKLATIVEVCPTSNMRIGNVRSDNWHSVHRFAAEGLDFVVGSDDPGVFGVTLRGELEWVSRATGIDYESLAARTVDTWQQYESRPAGMGKSPKFEPTS